MIRKKKKYKQKYEWGTEFLNFLLTQKKQYYLIIKLSTKSHEIELR